MGFPAFSLGHGKYLGTINWPYLLKNALLGIFLKLIMCLYLKCTELQDAKFTRDIYIDIVCSRNLNITSPNRFIIGT